MKLCLFFGLLFVGATRAVESELSTSETRVDPYYYGNSHGISSFHGPIGPVGPVGPLVGHGIYADHFGPGAFGYTEGLGAGHALIGRPYYGGHFIGGGANSGFNGGFSKSGFNEGGATLGNKGEQIYREAVDGGYKDNGYHRAGGFKNGGFQGVEGYNDNKHHLADDHANRLFYSNNKGGASNLGNGEHYDKNQGYSSNGFNALGDNQQKGYQKGHKKTGFHKSYHKDESGNDETFYDSDHDEGNYEHGKKYGDNFGTQYSTGLAGGKKFNEYSNGEQGGHGFIGNGKALAKNQGFKDYYGNNGYYDNSDRYGGSGGIQNSEFGKFGVNHGYQNGFNNGKNYAGLQNSEFGRKFYGPYGY